MCAILEQEQLHAVELLVKISRISDSNTGDNPTTTSFFRRTLWFLLPKRDGVPASDARNCVRSAPGMVTKKEESTPSKTATASKKAAAKSTDTAKKSPVKKSTPAEKKAASATAKASAKKSSDAPQAGSTKSLIFQAPDPALLPAPAKSSPETSGEGTVRRRSRANRPTLSPEEKKAKAEAEAAAPKKVRGSTRLEAKRQRRRDGRDGGRRRQSVTESEFLARRESVDRVMVVRERADRTQIAVLEDNVVVEHYVARAEESSLIGNVYLGRVQNVLPSMEAAFVDIGRGRNAVLYSGEVDWEAAREGDTSGPRRIELALKTGDSVLVQVTKDPVGHKGARLTSQISLPGRYLVYVPGGAMNGISRKLPDTERSRLKAILKKILPETAGVIVRTAAEGASEEQLTTDVERLQKQWEALSTQAEKAQAPELLHSEPDLLVKIIRDVFNEDFHKLVISGTHAHRTIEQYLSSVAPDLIARIEAYAPEEDPFVEYRVGEGIAKALDRKVWLPSGGSLVIDRTEAMTVVDVNTGKFVGSGGNLEETVTKNNIEAAEEIVRQLRLRDIGGIIVIDFIDMVLESNRDLVVQRLMECLGRDRTKHQVAEVTSLGLVQMTRKKLGLGLLETFSEACEACQGRGVVVHGEPVAKSKSESSPRKKKGSSKSAPTVEPHQITDGARNAIAAIAKSTVHSDTSAESKPAVALAEVPGTETATKDPLDSVLEALPDAPAPGQSKRRRRATSR
ncbi:Rne/Rng family ribonuclease [Pontimonas sp.]|nr:Rne/Rng family ribonuclease [Pontimonas sp.]MDB4606899.1 Rne/Rng family ribonuclease [Pontimonas sp.]